jgi:hypothetical protein
MPSPETLQEIRCTPLREALRVTCRVWPLEGEDQELRLGCLGHACTAAKQGQWFHLHIPRGMGALKASQPTPPFELGCEAKNRAESAIWDSNLSVQSGAVGQGRGQTWQLGARAQDGGGSLFSTWSTSL